MVVRRSAFRMWLIALGGIPLVVIAADVLTTRRFTNSLRELIFRPDRTQIFEPRDVIWAWAFLLFGGFLVFWGLKELFVPTKVMETRTEGLAVRLSGPLRSETVIPWIQISGVAATKVEDEGRKVPYLEIDLVSTEGLPPDPWGARWIGERQLGVLAEDWSVDPATVAAEISTYMSEQPRRASREAVASLWRESSEEE